MSIFSMRPIAGREGFVWLVISISVLLAGAVSSPAKAQPEPHETWLVSRASGVEGEVAIGTVGGPAVPPSIVSDNGRFVAFAAASDNIHPDVTDLNPQVYVRDLQTHDTRLASRASGASGDPAAGGNVFFPSISGDGRFVAFMSGASNLHPDGDSGTNVYVRDMQAQVTSLVSRADGVAGLPADDAWYGWPKISSNGRFVAFLSEATHLDPGVTEPQIHLYVRDLQTDTTTLVSRASGISGAIANASSEGLFNISADGRFVVFHSFAGNLDPAADGSTLQIFMRDLQNHETFLVSRADGTAGAVADVLYEQEGDDHPVGISADGSLVTFAALASNLHPDADGVFHQIYVRDVQTHTTSLASRAEGTEGAIGNNDSYLPEISGNGRFVTFGSGAANLHSDASGMLHVFVRDLQTHEIWLQSRAGGADGTPGDAVSFYPSLSADGQVLAFISQATNLHPDFNGTILTQHIYARGVAPDGDCPDGPDTPPPPAPDPDFDPDAESSRVGAMAGEFRVGESGAANYGIPIMTVPGSGGVAPEVALSYNSHGGRGPLGAGWGISGFSTITRCGQTLEQDGRTTGVTLSHGYLDDESGKFIDDGDRLCLDGQKLVLVNDRDYGSNLSEYRLEIDDFTRVTAYGHMPGGGAKYFTVERKDGSVSTYGSGDDGHSARVETVDSNPVVFAWPISRFQDSAGNYIDYQYFQPQPEWIEWLPEAAHYTGNDNAGTAPYASIEFVYEDLSESASTSGYVAGQWLRTTHRLAWIDSYGENDQLVRRYRLDYDDDSFGRELLESVQECWGTQTDECLEPTTFTWQSGELEIPHGVPQPDVQNINDVEAVLSGDLSGNGREEAVYLFQQSGQAYWGVVANKGADHDLHMRPGIPVSAGCDIDAEDIGSPALIDLVGEGYLGLAYAATNCKSETDNGIYYHPWFHGSSSDPASVGAFGAAIRIGDLPDTSSDPIFVGWQQVRLSSADWNGDGLADLILFNHGEDGQEQNHAYLYRNESGLNGLAISEDSYKVTELQEAQNWPPLFSNPDPDPGDPHPNRCENGHWELHRWDRKFMNAPVVEVDGSGQAGVIAQVIRYKRCWGTNPPNLNDLPPETVEELRSEGDYWILPDYRSSVFQLHIVDVDGTLQAQPKSAYEFGGAGVHARRDDIIIPTDINGDGLADMVLLRSDSLSGDPYSGLWEVRVYINDGKRLGYTGVQFKLKGELVSYVRVFDYTGDGHPDFVFPSEHDNGNANWLVSRWQAGSDGVGGFSPDCYDGDENNGDYGPGCITGPQTGNLNNSEAMFADVFGNGRMDLVAFFQQGGWNDCNLYTSSNYCVYASAGRMIGAPGQGRYLALNRITRITDGLGARTDIEYKSLSQRSVYTRNNSGPYTAYGTGSVIYDTIFPVYVVAGAESLAPRMIDGGFDPDATTRVEYYYTGARMQGGGRGMLGFREVASFDAQSGMLTRTSYRQDFPYIGMPEETQRWYHAPDSEPWNRSDYQPDVGRCEEPSFPGQPPYCANPAIKAGVQLSWALNTWDAVSTGDGVYHPYLAGSTERNYTPVYDDGELTDSQFTHRVVTLTGDLDDYGNPQLVDVATYTSENDTGGLVSRQTTLNEYTNDPNTWHLGRLTCAEVASERPGQSTQVRRSTFGYDAAIGILTRETVEPKDCADAAGQLTTTYTLDDFGNRISTTITGDGILRESERSHDSLGRFVQARATLIGGVPQTTETVLARDRYGNPTEVENGQGVTTYHYYDFMGRPHYTYTPDGAWSRTLYSLDVTDCPAGTAFVELGSAADGSTSEICRDMLGRESHTRARSFDGTWVHADILYDYASRVVAASEPYFEPEPEPELGGGAEYWTYTDYDELGRVLQVTHPDASVESWHYSGLTTTHTNVLNQPHTVTRNALGEKVEEIAADTGVTTYGYGALGQLIWADGPLTGDADRIDIEYDVLGHKTRMVDPDKGEWRYRHNALGELVCQQDAEGQGVSMEYDDLGRLVQRDDLSSVTNLDTCAGTLAGSSSWTYGNISGEKEFGQVLTESAEYEGDETDRAYTYDALGRVETVATTVTETGGFARGYEERTTYDQYGRVFQAFDASGEDRGIRYLYNGFGYLEALRETHEGAQCLVYWQVQEQDVRGNVIHALLGNGITAHALHDPATGRVLNLWTENDAGTIAAQDLELIWDELGNLEARHDHGHPAATLSERFFYDDRNRLEQVDRRTGSDDWQTAQMLAYDLAGNITTKSDVGGYTYGSTRPHAVIQAGNRSFQYDGNGNVVSDSEAVGQNRQYAYTAFNKVESVTSAGKTTEFHYGPDRARTLKREIESATVQSRTHYVGGLEIVWEGVSPPANGGEYRRYIGGVALVTFHAQTEISEIRYQHKDHLGSLTAVTDESGEIVARMAFDPWGQRRDPEDLTQPWEQWVTPVAPVWAEAMLAITPRGYTGHEHLDSHGVVHMGGRIYDPRLGRFLQADPLVEDVTTLNRYTYVHNNPLAYTDPSGYLSTSDFLKIAAVVVISVYTGGTASGASWGLFGASVGPGQAFATVVVGGALSGAVSSGTWEGALWGAFSAAAFYGFGQAIAGESWAQGDLWGMSGTGLAAKSVSHGVIGGTVSHVQGGKFGHGFISAGVTAAASPAISNIENPYVGGAVATMVGGTTSSLTGGKFANGAVTAAMSYAFGSLASRSRGGSSYVAGGQAEEISVEAARAHFDEILEALSAKGIDTSEIHFNEGYGLKDSQGNYMPVSDYDRFIRLSGRPGMRVVGGYHTTVREPGPWWKFGFGGRTYSRITMFRNAFSTPVHGVDLPSGATMSVNMGAGFQAGLFMVGHELGHRHIGSNELSANRYGLYNVYNPVCAGDPRC